MPTFQEVYDDPDMPNPNDFAYYFGSYTEAAKKACYVALGRLRMKNENLEKGRESEVGRKGTPREQLINELIALAEKLGHFPSPNEVKQEKDCKGYTTYIRALGGSWRAVTETVAEERLRRARNGDTEEQSSSPGETFEPVEAVTDEVVKEEPSKEDVPTEVVPEEKAAGRKIISFLPKEVLVIPADRCRSWHPIMPDGREVLILSKTVAVVDDLFETGDTEDVWVTRILRKPVLYDGQKMTDFPEPKDGVFYIVEKEVAEVARCAGRETFDLLFSEEYTDRGDQLFTDDLRVL